MEVEDNRIEFCLQEINHKEKFVWSLFLKQLMIGINVSTLIFLKGMIVGAPTVIIPQLKQETNTTTPISEEMTYWLSSIFGVGGLPWAFILPIIFEVYGRKMAHLVISVVTVCGFVVFCCSYTPVQILISEIILGILIGSSLCLMQASLSEYILPEHRGFFLTFKSASYLWGVWVANFIGTFFTWKYIGVVSLVCCVYLITLAAWPESPFWLASKGKYVDCAAAHRWLRGTDLKAEKELADLIKSQKILREKLKSMSPKLTFKQNFVKMLSSQEFSRPLILAMLVLLLFYLSGKLVCSMYIIQIVQKVTYNKSTAYKTMLILDGVAVFGAYTGSILSIYLKRRLLLLSSLTVSTSVLILLFIYLTSIKMSLINENNFVTITFLILHSVAATGANILCGSITGELLPLQFKGWAISFLSFYLSLLHFTTLRIAPELFKIVGLNLTFLIYGLGSTICLVLLYKYLPETKDKTLLQIEEYFKDPKNVDESRGLM